MRCAIFEAFAKNNPLSHYVLQYTGVNQAEKILTTGIGKDSAVWEKFQILKIGDANFPPKYNTLIMFLLLPKHLFLHIQKPRSKWKGGKCKVG